MKNLKWIAAVAFGAGLGALYLVRTAPHTNVANSIQLTEVVSQTEEMNRLPVQPATKNTIIVSRTNELVTTDSTDPDYDPAMLIRVNRADASELFAMEPRVKSWAEGFETHVEKQVQSALADVQIGLPVAVACKTATCRVDLDASGLSDSEAELVRDYLTYTAPIGDMTQGGDTAGTSDPGHLIIYTALSPELRTQSGFSDFVADFAEGGGERIETQKKLLIEKLQANKD